MVKGTSGKIDLMMVMGTATERSIDVEIASKVDSLDGITVTPVSFVQSKESIFGLEILSLDCDSVFDLAAYPKLYQLFRSRKPDIVHNQSHLIGAPIRAVTRAAGVPVLVSSEHSPRTSFNWVKRLASNSTNWLCDAIVANSHSTMDSLHWFEKGMLRAFGTELTTIQHGVDIERVNSIMRNEDSPELPSGDPVVGFAGRLVEAKQVDRLVEAVAMSRKRGVDASLAVVGEGPCQEHLESLSEERGIEQYVQFYDFLPRRNVWAFMNEVDIMAYPSAYEGFGVAAAESMATGTPTILSDIPVYTEVAGNTGFLVEAQPAELARSIVALSDPKIRQKAGKRAKERIENNFRIDRTAEQHLQLYRRLIND